MTTLRILSLTSEQLMADARASLERGHGWADLVYREVMRTGDYDPDRLGMNRSVSSAWKTRYVRTPLSVKETFEESTSDGRTTIKAVFETEDGLEIEAVRIPMRRERYTLCVSSQVGCRLACAFCETGRMGLIRNLRADEIVAQVVSARAVLGWSISHIVFMGMGEPLDNVHELVKALKVLADPRGLAFAQPRLRVCTAGHVKGLDVLKELGWPRLDISVSLNAPTDEKRNRLMPINRHVPLHRLQEALVAYREVSRSVFAVNYCLLPGLNDGAADAEAVAAFCRPLGRCIVHVIPYNPGSRPLTRAPEDHEVDRFSSYLKEAGVPVQRRRTKGRSVMAACGQLGNLELRTQRQRRLPVYDA
ncbi:MAG: radical SAM protein [Myxococcales bacterium]|nr:radical SAM protein [Myxococcales bacterium]